MGKKSVKPGQMRRVGGVVMMSAACGMVFAWVFLGLSFFVAALLLIIGFYFLFM